MRQSDIDKIAEIIMRSGIATKIQRGAIVQRIRDWFEQRKIENASDNR